ncbi:MAG TPA: DUF4258 domain-containing protein [Bryobacteraceae bacterium]|nr:DUF4258 domain-containing protein [Bryobacteraceae bacterium]
MARAPVPKQPLEFIRECLLKHQIRWTYHVTMRLKQRSLGSEILNKQPDSLEIIESYPDDKYLPSYLLRGEFETRVFHVQIAADVEGGNIRVVTMYIPAPEEWDLEFRARRFQS